MGAISIEKGLVKLYDGTESYILSAEEIFSVVFEGTVLLRNIKVSSEDFLSTGLEFCKYPAKPTVVLQSMPQKCLSTVECRFIAKAVGIEIDVIRCSDNTFVGYALNKTTWMPLPRGSNEAAIAFLKKADLADFGPISIGQYLRILQLRDPVLLIEDRTQNVFSASNLANTLKGNVPIGLEGTLYPYQSAGYHWLAYMRQCGLGSIIADEMGLGKTIQVICLILDAKNNRFPTLVVAPATLLENWKREIQRFAPSLKVRIHRGARRTGFPDDLLGVDVVLTSYDTAVADVSLLRNIIWDILVIDEAQAIKNPAAKRTLRLKTLPRRYAVAMTGTPVENRLTDLWSITDFVLPSLLGTQANFQHNHPDTLDGAAMLEPILTPIILRRKVADVAQDLPERIVIPQPLELDAESAEVYEALRMSISSGGGTTLTALVALRMFCTHPWLVDQFTHIVSAVDCSVKLQRLLEVMEEIISDNCKALIFTSYQESADLLLSEISSKFGIHVDIIDGRTPVEERQSKVDRFTTQKSAVALVLNPRAAGTGLNITAANHVIHFNLEWNPAVEDQASARAHRRGQTQIVTVHRFFYIDTVEDVINDRMTRKRQLASTAVIGTNGIDADMQDILQALRVSPVNKNIRG